MRQRGDFANLIPNGKVDIEVEASMKREKNKLTLELVWHNAEETEEHQSDFKITSVEPEPVVTDTAGVVRPAVQ